MSSYILKLDLNVLEHLGINLYSNVPAVLSEIVANAWDADATDVTIEINRHPSGDRTKDTITIQDNGTGMTNAEVNARFLTVGYRRRDDQPGLTKRGRRPMGRKGIGKLSLFSIANNIIVETSKNDDKSAFEMRLTDIRKAIESHAGKYEPKSLSVENIEFEQGTRITLSELKKIQTIRTAEALRRRLARRFSIIGPKNDFNISVDGRLVTPSDRGYYDKIQFLWTYGDQAEVRSLATKLVKQEDRSSHLFDSTLKISGWLATVEKSVHLKDEEGENLNRIAIFVRGKMAQEDLLADFTERGVYASYLIGELEVVGLDNDDEEDAATSSRQRIVEDDPRYVRLTELLHKELKYIQSKWTEWRTLEGAKKALEIPAVNEWIKGLEPDIQKKAHQWLGKLNRIRTDDPDEQKQLIKHAVLAFEFYRWNRNIDSLDSISEENLQGILELFSKLDNLEASLYGQIVQQRIVVIDTLLDKVDDDTREKVIQEYIFDHLWLIDPSWERAEAPAMMEKRVERLFEDIDAGLTDEEKRARIDISYRKTAGTHVIIELKRPRRRVDTYELAAQVKKYRSGMLKILEALGRSNEPVEFVCLLGDFPPEYTDSTLGPDFVKQTLEPLNARIVLYDSLLNDAYTAYSDYLKEKDKVDSLSKVIKAIEDYSLE